MEQNVEQLKQELQWMQEQQDILYQDFCAMREQLAELSGEHAALEKAFHALEEEKNDLENRCTELRETLIRERRAHAQGDSLKYLKWHVTEVKNEEMILISGHNKGCVKIVVPEVIEGKKVLGVEEEAFAGCDTLEEIDLPYGIRAIADRAFIRCPKLKKVTIPNSVVWMGEDSFFESTQAAFVCEENTYAWWFAKNKGHEILIEE